MTNYEKYRGKCKEMSEDFIKANPTFSLVRGYYWCPILNTEEEHWWTKSTDGQIYDPTALQFPSGGCGTYTEFNGFCVCETCGKETPEEVTIFMGRYPVCSTSCAKTLVGL